MLDGCLTWCKDVGIKSDLGYMSPRHYHKQVAMLALSAPQIHDIQYSRSKIAKAPPSKGPIEHVHRPTGKTPVIYPCLEINRYSPTVPPHHPACIAQSVDPRTCSP